MSFENLDEAAARGMSIAFQAAIHPERTAIFSTRGNRSFAELNSRANQVARLLRDAGIQAGDGVALLSPNQPEFAEVFFACQRTGTRLTPVNWHLTAEEIAYIVADSGAKALIADASLEKSALLAGTHCTGLTLRLSIGRALDGFHDYNEAIATVSADDIDAPLLGDTMLYTSGTTGHPKGVRRAIPTPEKAVEGMKLLSAVFGFEPGGNDVALATGPLYHSGPIHLCLSIPVNSGIPTILMERWGAAEMLAPDRPTQGYAHVLCADDVRPLTRASGG